MKERKETSCFLHQCQTGENARQQAVPPRFPCLRAPVLATLLCSVWVSIQTFRQGTNEAESQTGVAEPKLTSRAKDARQDCISGCRSVLELQTNKQTNFKQTSQDFKYGTPFLFSYEEVFPSHIARLLNMRKS